MSVRIIKQFCKGCGYCIDTCPNKLFKLKIDPTYLNSKGYYVPIITNSEKCSKCRMCELICPDFAIEIDDQNIKTTEE
ncbi:MAG: ferredoxin family protein [Promethearchaeota archaeon]